MAAPVLSAEDIEEQTKLQNTLSKIKHVVIVISGKGGVGKSTVSSNLAEALAMDGYQVGILDVDITGPNIPKMFHVEDQRLTVENDKLVPVQVPPSLKMVSMAFLLPSQDDAVMWRGPVKMGAVRQLLEDVEWGNLDYLVIDMPPGTGDEALSIVQLIPRADGCVVVTTPQDVALLDSRKSITFARQTGIPVIGLIENMSGFVCPHCGQTVDIFKSGGGEKTAKDMNVRFLGKVPIEQGVMASGDNGLPIVVADPQCASAKAFMDIASKVEEIVEKEPEYLSAQHEAYERAMKEAQAKNGQGQ